MESEIFGHVKGAFTGAIANRDGAAFRADGGTLFLDEICELDPALQAKLLGEVQTGSCQPVGGNTPINVDLRIICATNRDPMDEVQSGRFRADLFYRLHVVPIEIPPLRERGQDVIRVARTMLDRYSAEEGKRFQCFAPQTEGILQGHDWPGNVRELQNVIRNIVVLHDGEAVTPDMLPTKAWVKQGASPSTSRTGHPAPVAAEPPRGAPSPPIRPLWLIERETIEQAIEQCQGNIAEAAALLEISPSTIYRKRQAWDL